MDHSYYNYCYTHAAVQPSGVLRQPCLLCEDHPASIRFSPCGHTVLCSECAQRATKCLQCRVSQPFAFFVAIDYFGYNVEHDVKGIKTKINSFILHRLTWKQKLLSLQGREHSETLCTLTYNYYNYTPSLHSVYTLSSFFYLLLL